MQSLSYESRTEGLNPQRRSSTHMLMLRRLDGALSEYLSRACHPQSSMLVVTIEDFCNWIGNETAEERDRKEKHEGT